MNTLRKRILIPIYSVKLTLIIADQISDIILNLNKDEQQASTSGAYTFLDWPEAHILFRSDCVTEGNITHECDHLCHAIMRFIGLKECDGSDEGYAYLAGWLSERVHEKIKQAKIKIT